MDSIMDQPEAKSRKDQEWLKEMKGRTKSWSYLARAVDAINTPPPSVSQTPLVKKSESVAFGNYVSLTLAKLTPGQFRRAKKLISDVLYDMEEKDGIEQAGSCPRSFPQHTTIGYVENYGRPASASTASSASSTQSTVTIKVSLWMLQISFARTLLWHFKIIKEEVKNQLVVPAS